MSNKLQTPSGSAIPKTKTLTQSELMAQGSYDPLTGKFTGKGKGKVIGTLNGHGYINITIKGAAHSAHQLAWLYIYGQPPTRITHINHDRTDNRIVNLRETTRSESAIPQAVRDNNTSGYTGVSWNKRARKWEAKIMYSGKRKYLGYFDDIKQAHQARVNAERTIYGVKK